MNTTPTTDEQRRKQLADAIKARDWCYEGGAVALAQNYWEPEIERLTNTLTPQP